MIANFRTLLLVILGLWWMLRLLDYDLIAAKVAF